MLSVRVERELLDWAKDYAQSNGTSLSQLVRDFLEHLKSTIESGDEVAQV